MRFEFVERHFSHLFSAYIGFVSNHSVPFFVIPLALSFFLSTGIFNHSNALIKDTIELYTPTNAKARQELNDLKSLFYINDSDPFYASRRYELRRMGYIIVTSKTDNADILDAASMEAALRLWNIVQTITIDDEGKSAIVENTLSNSYSTMCVKLPITRQISNEIFVFLTEAIVNASFKNISIFLPSQNNGSNDFCVSNPLIELFKYLLVVEQQYLNSDFKFQFFNSTNLALSANNVSNTIMPMFNKIISMIASPKSFMNNSALITDTVATFQRKISILLNSLGSGIVTNLLGGVEFDEKTRQVAGAKAIMLPYALRHGTSAEDERAEKWELKLTDFLRSFHSSQIRATCWTYETLSAESARDREQLKRMFLPCFIVVSLYTVLQCCVFSWRRSRPLLALGGVICAAMSITSGIGLLLHCGFKITSIAYSMPFIVFSVGVDNVFILLSAWRATSPTLSLQDRLAKTYGDAAVSITITSLTDFISFGVGCLTPYPSVQMFCIFAVVAVTFTYFYQLTFLAAIMCWSCWRETENRHCLTLKKLQKKKKSVSKNHMKYSWASSLPPPPGYQTKTSKQFNNSFFPQIQDSSREFFAQNVLNNVSQGVIQINFDKSFKENHFLSKFFYLQYSNFLRLFYVRFLILSAFFGYLCAAFYGCFHLKLGLEPYDLLPKNSYGKTALEMTRKYFTENGGYLHVWMYNLSLVPLGHRRLWVVLEKEIELYEYTEFTFSADSWLRSFFEEQKGKNRVITEKNFTPLLLNFLQQPINKKYTRDVVFDNELKWIVASRVTVQLRFIDSKNQSRAMKLFRNIAKSSYFPTGVYGDFFLFAEQYDTVLPGTLTSIVFAGVAVVIVSVSFIPETIAAFWVFFTILSINVGILGFMTFWSIRLDFISMVTIVMSIGFCVDFAAHLSYNYARSSNCSPDERLRRALYCVGTPILQSASSTILGALFMSSTESYIFRSFLKTIILVVFLGVLHGIVILPVLLTTFDPERWKIIRKEKANLLQSNSIQGITSNNLIVFNNETNLKQQSKPV